MEENKVQKISFFKKVWYSITKFEKYPDMASEGLKSTIKYLLIAVAIVTIFIVIGSLIEMNNLIGKVSNYIETDIPDFSYSDGNLSMEIEEPIIIDVDDKEYSGIDKVYINPNIENDEEKSKIEEENSVVGVSVFFYKNQVILISKGENNNITRQPYTYKDFISSYTQEDISTFNKQELLEYITSEKMYNYYMRYGFSILIYLIFMNLMVALLDAFELAVLGWITAITARVKMRLLAIFNMSIYALTLPMILNIVYIVINYFTDFNISYFSIAYITIAYVYLAAAIFIIKDDYIKKQEEVEKIKKEQIKVREEIRQQEEKDKENKGEQKPKKKKETKDKEQEKDNNTEEPKGSEA